MSEGRLLRASSAATGVGGYEPIVAIETDDTTRPTALAHEPELCNTRPRVRHARAAPGSAAEAGPSQKPAV